MTIVISSIVNFAVVLGILYKFLRKPAAQFLVTRSDNVARTIREAEALAKESGAILHEWESKWNAAAAQSQRMFTETQETLKKSEVRALEKAKREAERIQKEAHQLVESELHKAKSSLQSELIRRSLEVVRQYFSHNLDEKDKRGLVTSFTETVGNGAGK